VGVKPTNTNDLNRGCDRKFGSHLWNSGARSSTKKNLLNAVHRVSWCNFLMKWVGIFCRARAFFIAWYRGDRSPQPYLLISFFLLSEATSIKNRRSWSEGRGEWEIIKIFYMNLVYILESIWYSSLLAWSRPSSYSQAIGSQNRARNHNRNTERC
jgi:hypothetical protein